MCRHASCASCARAAAAASHRSHRLQPHHQRRKLSAAEICPDGAGHQQYRSSPHRRLRFLRGALADQNDRAASLRDCHGTAPAILLLGNDPTEQHPLLAWNLRTNVRHHNARIYIVNHAGIKLRAAGARDRFIIPQDGYANCRALPRRRWMRPFPATRLRRRRRRSSAKRCAPSPTCLIIFGSEYRGRND
jgi:hypothetical protein